MVTLRRSARKEPNPSGQMSLTEHLAELRMRIIRAGLATLIGVVIVVLMWDWVLEVLTGRPGELVTRSELHAAIWGATTFVDHDQGLNYCIRQIRRALGDTARRPRYIETLPRRGYRFLPAVKMISATRPAGARQSSSRRFLLPATLLLTGLLLGAWLDHKAVASGLHDEMTTWIHTRTGVSAADCPWAR